MTTTSTSPIKTQQKFKYLIILDFEATCFQNSKHPNQEIIEFPSVIINTETLETVSTFREYVKPIICPQLSDFCTELTGIEQKTVENAKLFPEVLKLHTQWVIESLPENSNYKNDDYCFVTCGDWDLRTALPKQLKLCNNLQKPTHFNQWINIKKQFQQFYPTHPISGMTGMLRILNLELEGRHHCGLSDSLNIARIAKKLIEEGCNFDLISTMK